AEDGIRDRNVTGVQTCALPISERSTSTRGGCSTLRSTRRGPRRGPGLRCNGGAELDSHRRRRGCEAILAWLDPRTGFNSVYAQRSEERRVGKEGRSGWVVEG